MRSSSPESKEDGHIIETGEGGVICSFNDEDNEDGVREEEKTEEVGGCV